VSEKTKRRITIYRARRSKKFLVGTEFKLNRCKNHSEKTSKAAQKAGELGREAGSIRTRMEKELRHIFLFENGGLTKALKRENGKRNGTTNLAISSSKKARPGKSERGQNLAHQRREPGSRRVDA